MDDGDGKKRTTKKLTALAMRTGSGVQKPTKRKQKMSAKMKKRKEMRSARAENFHEQLEKRVSNSTKRGKKIKTRRHGWDLINEKEAAEE